MGVVNPAVFLTQRSRGAERQRILRGASRDFGKRVAARGFARARRAAGGFACKPASALGPPQRCVASPPPDLETRFAGHGSPTEKGLRGAFRPGFKPSWDFSKNFLSRRTAGFPIRRGEESPEGAGARRRWRRGTCSPDRRRGRAPSRRRRLLAQPVSQARAKRPTSHPLLLRLSASLR